MVSCDPVPRSGQSVWSGVQEVPHRAGRPAAVCDQSAEGREEVTNHGKPTCLNRTVTKHYYDDYYRISSRRNNVYLVTVFNIACNTAWNAHEISKKYI